MALRNEKMSGTEDAQSEVTASKELTAEQYIDAVAKIIAVKTMLDEQLRTGQVYTVERNMPVAEVLGLGRPFTVFQKVICIEGDDLTNVEEFLTLRDQLEKHSTAAQATANTNAKVAKARADYSLFKIAQGAPNQEQEHAQQNQDRPESPDSDKDGEEYPLERITI